MARELVQQDVEEIVGVGNPDGQALICKTCFALVYNDWLTRLRHAEWHIAQGHVHLPGS